MNTNIIHFVFGMIQGLNHMYLRRIQILTDFRRCRYIFKEMRIASKAFTIVHALKINPISKERLHCDRRMEMNESRLLFLDNLA